MHNMCSHNTQENKAEKNELVRESETQVLVASHGKDREERPLLVCCGGCSNYDDMLHVPSIIRLICLVDLCIWFDWTQA